MSYKCEECEYSTERSDNYSRHLKSKGHLKRTGQLSIDKKRYKCPDCTYESDRRINLVRHKQIHEKIRCSFCSQTVTDMNQHRRTEEHMDSVFGMNGKLNGIIKSYLKNSDDVNFRKVIEKSAYEQALKDRKRVVEEMAEVYKARDATPQN